MSEWQPIETAPRDGEQFLGYCPYGVVRCVSCWFSVWAGDALWFYFGNQAVIAKSAQNYVTHWMPLPPPPEQTGDTNSPHPLSGAGNAKNK